MKLAEIVEQETGFLKHEMNGIWGMGEGKNPVRKLFLLLLQLAMTTLLVPGYVVGFLSRISGIQSFINKRAIQKPTLETSDKESEKSCGEKCLFCSEKITREESIPGHPKYHELDEGLVCRLCYSKIYLEPWMGLGEVMPF
jgi:hypothetical protein